MNILIQISIPNEKDFHVTHVNGFILLYLLTIIVKISGHRLIGAPTLLPPKDLSRTVREDIPPSSANYYDRCFIKFDPTLHCF